MGAEKSGTRGKPVPIARLEFIELKAETEINSGELRAPAGDFPGRCIDLRYLVVRAGREVAIVWYNTFPPDHYLVLYKLFVAAKFRRRGIGSALIQHAEALARARGYNRILVHAQPLSDDITEKQLIGWYEKRGFKCTDPERETYVKNISPAAPAQC